VYPAACRDDDVDDIVRNFVWHRHRARAFRFPPASLVSANRITIERHSASFFSYLVSHDQKINIRGAYP
jgi:hypothetical protein